ncbi:MAG: response regulator transcription factor [Oscillospiraceae bacterium]|jgi:two-component system response regulator VicR|nr:response regulator transcription factor [Oscillospiraceae bacterium]
MARTILIVDDEPSIVDILKFNLTREHYAVLTAFDGKAGLELALLKSPDLILLDVMLPVMNGFEVCKKIRETDKLTPILMLTAREEERDKVLGLDYGADDYILKPFGVRELLARIKANLRRADSIAAASPIGTDEIITSGRLSLDLAGQFAIKDGIRIDLTEREYELLRCLFAAPGKVISRDELMTGAWGSDFLGDTRMIDVTISRLREKLEDVPDAPAIIVTKRGIGYYLGV